MRRPYRAKKPTLRLYFDTETYNDFTHLKNFSPKNKIDELPLIVPYLIGVCTDEPNSFQHFFSTEEFIHWLFNISSGYTTSLYAFNVDYDFQAIKSSIMTVYPTARIEYRLTSDKKFIVGRIIDKTHKIDIRIRDFWVWDKTMSLNSYYKLIKDLAKENPEWQDLLTLHGITNLEKLTIDYYKRDLYQVNKQFYYLNENNINKKLDLDHELKYLKQDVIGLPIIYKYITKFKNICINGLQLADSVSWSDVATAYSIPAFSKILCSAYLKKDFDSVYRVPIELWRYAEQDLSYFGGFTANNKHIYKLSNCRDNNNNPKIYSYDVNSMYPAIMYDGLPCGEILDTPPEGEYVVWYTISFPEEYKPGILYEYKSEYDQLNNSFFGDDYFTLGKPLIRYYIEKSVYEMFIRVCNSKVKLHTDDIKYQRLSRVLTPFIETIYEKKSNAKTKEERNAFKLMLNSLYGKMAERFHLDYYSWNSENQIFERLRNDREDRDNILAGCYITSKARVKLFEAIISEIENGNTVLCVDTDSIKLIVNNPVKLEIHSTKLGAWKHEYTMTDFYHNGKNKKYLLYNRDSKEIKMAVSGIPKETLNNLLIEDLITLYDPNHDVLFPKIKNISKRNKFFQICISKVDVRFNYSKNRPVTHLMANNAIVPVCLKR